jgi:transcriptional regulator with PAS, ATPase and Fis domain
VTISSTRHFTFDFTEAHTAATLLKNFSSNPAQFQHSIQLMTLQKRFPSVEANVLKSALEAHGNDMDKAAEWIASKYHKVRRRT